MRPPGPGTQSPGPLRVEDAVVRVMRGSRGGQLDLIPSRFDFSKHLRRSVKPDATVLDGWRLFGHEIDHSRGYPKLMRGDYRWLGNAKYFDEEFGKEFFQRPGMKPQKR